jgi:hypothetical protein
MRSLANHLGQDRTMHPGCDSHLGIGSLADAMRSNPRLPTTQASPLAAVKGRPSPCHSTKSAMAVTHSVLVVRCNTSVLYGCMYEAS